MNSLKNQKNNRYQPGNMKITSDLTNLTTAILILTLSTENNILVGTPHQQQ
jgi:hypothetical protein